MKQFLLALFILSAGFMKSQCAMTASVTQPSCPGNCDGIVTINLSGGCTAFPYLLTMNGGSCSPSGSYTMTSASMTFSNLCACGSPFSAILTNSLSFPVAFTNFAITGGVPLTIFQLSNAPATCSSCCNGSIATTTGGGTGPYSYTWTPMGGNTGTMTNACPGVYTLCVADANGCTACNTYTIGFATGLSEYEANTIKVMYSKDEIVIMDATPINRITIYDLTGRVVYRTENENQKEVRLNKNQFNRGVYVMSIEGSQRLSKHRIIVE